MADDPKRPLRGKGSGNQKHQQSDKERGTAAKRENRWSLVWFGVKTFLIVVGGAIVIGIGAGAGYAASLLKGLPSITAQTFTNTSAPSVVYDKSGKVIGKFDENGNREPVKNLNQVSPYLVNSFVAAEDRTFWTNIGINPVAIARAFVQDITTHHIESGASTITQQTVKLAVFPEQQRTVQRKIQEIALAIKVNHILTKSEIMTDYMNWVYYGNLGPHPVYGVQSASQIIFHKNVKNLNLPEAALLAAIPNNASYYSPYVYSTKSGWSVDLTHLVQRQHYILSQMLQHGMIKKSQYNAAMKFDIQKTVYKPEQSANNKYQYLMQDEIPYLVAVDLGYISPGESAANNTKYPEELADAVSKATNILATGGYKIHSTIDINLENHVKKVLSESKWYKGTLKPDFPVQVGKKTYHRLNQYQTGVTIIDNKTGAILAIGGGNPNQGTYNGKPVTSLIDYSDTPRQPGSSIKPLIDYGPAFEMHILTAASPLNDAPTTFSGNFSPHDAESGWRGIVSVRTALTQSYNVPAVEVLQKVGITNAEGYLAKMNIDNNSRTVEGERTWMTTGSQNDSNLSSAIGGLSNGLTTQQMASAYTVFSNQGVYKQTYMIAKIVDSSGQTVYQHKQAAQQVFSPQTAYVLDSIMRDVVIKGTAADVGQYFGSTPVYGKTGTSDSDQDGWFVGFTQSYTAALWTGYQYATPISAPSHPNLYNQKFNIWNELMAPVIKKEHPKPIANPGNIVTVGVCKYSGQLPTSLCQQLGGTYDEIFIQGTQPTQKDQMHVQVEYTVINGKKYLATTNTPPGQVFVGVFLKPPFKITGALTDTSKYYVPTQADPRGGTVLKALSSTQTVKAPSTPKDVSVTAMPNSVQIQWSPVSGADGYTVYRSTSANGPYEEITRNPVSGSSYLDKSIPANTAVVYYEVYAISNKLQSTPSSPVQAVLSTSGNSGNNENTTVPAANSAAGP